MRGLLIPDGVVIRHARKEHRCGGIARRRHADGCDGTIRVGDRYGEDYNTMDFGSYMTGTRYSLPCLTANYPDSVRSSGESQ